MDWNTIVWNEEWSQILKEAGIEDVMNIDAWGWEREGQSVEGMKVQAALQHFAPNFRKFIRLRIILGMYYYTLFRNWNDYTRAGKDVQVSKAITELKRILRVQYEHAKNLSPIEQLLSVSGTRTYQEFDVDDKALEKHLRWWNEENLDRWPGLPNYSRVLSLVSNLITIKNAVVIEIGPSGLGGAHLDLLRKVGLQAWGADIYSSPEQHIKHLPWQYLSQKSVHELGSKRGNIEEGFPEHSVDAIYVMSMEPNVAASWRGDFHERVAEQMDAVLKTDGFFIQDWGDNDYHLPKEYLQKRGFLIFNLPRGIMLAVKYPDLLINP
jgi:hypothetical protein